MHRLIYAFIGITLIAASVHSAIANRTEILERIDQQPAFIPEAPFVRIASLGYTNIAADLMWLSAVQYIGTHAVDGRYPRLDEYLRTVTSLDPHFRAPYTRAITLLPDAGKIAASIHLGIKGNAAFPADPDMPFYHAYNYYQYIHAFDKAATWFFIAASRPNALKASKSLAATNLAKAGVFEVARYVWQNIYDTSDDSITKEAAGLKIERINNLSRIYDAMNRYEQSNGTPPKTIDDLVRHRLLDRIPTDSYSEVEYYINSDTRIPDVRRKQ